MAVPLQSRDNIPEELKNYKKILSEMDSDMLVAGVRKGKIRLGTGDKTTTRGAGRRMTLRMTPDLQKKWVGVIDELSKTTADTLPEIKQRASVQFAAAFKGGGFVIEVKDNGNRTAYATEETAKQLQDGTIVLKKNGTSTLQYESVNVIHSEEFLQDLSSSFLTIILQDNEPAAIVKSESIKDTKDTSHASVAVHTDISDKVKLADSDKKVPVKKPETAKREKTEAEINNDIRKNEEAAHEQEHNIQHAELTEEREQNRVEAKLESSEQTHEEVQAIEERKTIANEQSEAIEAIKDEQTSPFAPDETVT